MTEVMAEGGKYMRATAGYIGAGLCTNNDCAVRTSVGPCTLQLHHASPCNTRPVRTSGPYERYEVQFVKFQSGWSLSVRD